MKQNSQKTQASERVVTLLESIDRHLKEVLRGQDVRPMEPHGPNETYTRTQAARHLAVSLWSVDKARKEGLLVEARRIGQRDVRITAESLVAFMRTTDTASVQVRKL